ncbi:MAG: 3-oxoacyl-[acyl-carrier-protein] reductase FabG [Ignavibacteriaceae bacterium]|nr:3-oxoacyl-[acyl-carrier-protein] reductase FabG [Ignavibacteriaceae bacterium]
MSDLMMNGKTALVTGGSRGIGRAILDSLARNGCQVVFTYLSSQETAQNIEEEYTSQGMKVFGVKADGSKAEEVEASVRFAVEKTGSVDILINNAGITKDNLLMRMTAQDFEAVLSANLNSVFYYTKAATKIMMQKRWGRIINITSVVGLMGNAGQSNYAASKAGVIGFTKSIAKELASRNITANCIAPGFIETDMTAKLKDEQKDALLNLIPLRKFGQADDIAKVTAFLCSDAAGYITGQTIAVDGGMTM